MKKIFMILSAALLLAGSCLFTSCKNGEDGENGTSAEALILRETGDKWYKYNETSGQKIPSGTTSDSKTVELTDIYLKYDTSAKKLVIAAVSTTALVPAYATTSKELLGRTWAASAVTLRVTGKISKVEDPTKGKVLLTDVTDWGNFSADALITKLFEE